MVGLAMLLLALAITLWWFFGQDTLNNLLGGGVQPGTAPTMNFSITAAPPATQVQGILPSTLTPGPASTLAPSGHPYPPAIVGSTQLPYPLPAGGPTLTPWPTNTKKP